MIHAYTWQTPNGHKLHIMLHECGLEHEIHPIDIGKGDQFAPDFLAISPNNKIPAIVDTDGPGGKEISVFESGAILYYLARKTGRFLPDEASDPAGHYAVMEWLMWQMGGVGPMLGQNHHFTRYAPEKIPYAVDRYVNETKRLYGVADTRLGKTKYLAGDDYTIADIATFPWFRRHEVQSVDLADYPNVARWFAEIEARPAVQKGVAVLDGSLAQTLTKEQFDNYFGANQNRRR